MEDQTERPIGYASRTLSPAERKYAQLDKEALSIVFGVKLIHQYLYGRKFTILSDHKPLQFLLGETQGIPDMASVPTVITYVTKPGADHANADGLGRLPVFNHIATVSLPGDVLLLFRALETSPVSAV